MDFCIALFGNISTSDIWMEYPALKEDTCFLILVAGATSKISKNKAEKVKGFLSKKNPCSYSSLNINDLCNIEKDHGGKVLETLHGFQIPSRLKVVFSLGPDTPLCDNFQRWLEKNRIPYGLLTKNDVLWKFDPQEESESWGILPYAAKKTVSSKEISKRKRNLQRNQVSHPPKKKIPENTPSQPTITHTPYVEKATEEQTSQIQRIVEETDNYHSSFEEYDAGTTKEQDTVHLQKNIQTVKTEQQVTDKNIEKESFSDDEVNHPDIVMPVSAASSREKGLVGEEKKSQESNTIPEITFTEPEAEIKKKQEEKVDKSHKQISLPFSLKKIKDSFSLFSGKKAMAKTEEIQRVESEKQKQQEQYARIEQSLTESIEQIRSEMEQAKEAYLYYLWQSFKLSVCVRMDIPPEDYPVKESAVYSVWLALLQSVLIDDFDQNKGTHIHWTIDGYPNFEKLKSKAVELYQHRIQLNAPRNFRPPKGCLPVIIPVMDKTPASNQNMQLVIRQIVQKKEDAKKRYLYFNFIYMLSLLDKYTGLLFSSTHPDAAYTDYLRSDYLNALYNELLKASDAGDFKNSLQVGYQINICRIPDTDFFFLKKTAEDTAASQKLFTSHPETVDTSVSRQESKEPAKADKPGGRKGKSKR